MKLGRPAVADIERVREALRKQRFESAFAWDKNGNLIAARDGDLNNVSVLDSEWKLLNGGFVLHNHPKGSTFSAKDVNRAREFKLARMEVVTPKETYLLEPSNRGWSLISDQFWNREILELLKRQRSRRDDFVRGTISERELLEALHEDMNEFRKTVHVRYGRLERR